MNLSVAPLSPASQPAVPAARLQALRRFLWNCSWVGCVESGDANSSRVSRGQSTYRWVAGEAWLAGETERQEEAPDGSWAPTWSSHSLIGWDRESQQYRGTVVDSHGVHLDLRGFIHGDQLVLEGASGGGELRLTWDMSDPSDPVCSREYRSSHGPWVRVDERQLCAES